jgi:hypothetical protein
MSGLEHNHQVVRCVCYACGWFRVVGFSGKYGSKRAIIRFRTDADSNLVKAEVLVGDRQSTVEEIAGGAARFHDLVAEAHEQGLCKAERSYDFLFEGRKCPRCKNRGHLQIGWLLYSQFDFARYRSWRETHRQNEDA